MAIEVADLRAKFETVAGRISDWAKLHRFWFESAGVTAIALLALAILGGAALRRAAAWEDQIRELRAIEEGMQEVVTNFVPADSTEPLQWRGSEQILMGLSAATSDPLAVAGLIARRAQEVGVLSLRVSLLTGAESIPGTISAGAWRAEPRETIILAQLIENLGTTTRFIGVLPPYVEVVSVTSVPAGGSLRSEIRLVVRDLRGPG